MSDARKPDCWSAGVVQTTIELPDDLVREIKVRAALGDRKLKDLVAELLRPGLGRASSPTMHQGSVSSFR